MVGRAGCRSGLTVSDVDETLLVEERGRLLEFSYTDMLCYAGPYSPAGVANAFKVMQRAFAALSPNQPPQRRSVVIRTAFQGPGARDGFEAVTRAVTDGRYTVDPALARPGRGRLLQSFVFQISIAGRGGGRGWLPAGVYAVISYTPPPGPRRPRVAPGQPPRSVQHPARDVRVLHERKRFAGDLKFRHPIQQCEN